MLSPRGGLTNILNLLYWKLNSSPLPPPQILLLTVFPIPVCANGFFILPVGSPKPLGSFWIPLSHITLFSPTVVLVGSTFRMPTFLLQPPAHGTIISHQSTAVVSQQSLLFSAIYSHFGSTVVSQVSSQKNPLHRKSEHHLSCAQTSSSLFSVWKADPAMASQASRTSSPPPLHFHYSVMITLAPCYSKHARYSPPHHPVLAPIYLPSQVFTIFSWHSTHPIKSLTVPSFSRATLTS